MDQSEKVKKFKNWCCEHNIDITYVFWAEKIILKKSHWSILRIYPSEVTDLIINDILIKNCFPKEYIPTFKEIVNTFILFSFNEYSIYKKYNQVIIALACALIGISYPSDFTQNFKEEDLNKYKKILQEEINKLEIIKDEKLIEECKKNILDLLENNEEEDEGIEEEDYMNTALTRSSSTLSLIETFNKYDKNKTCIEDNLYIKSEIENLFVLENKESDSFLRKKRKESDIIFSN